MLHTTGRNPSSLRHSGNFQDFEQNIVLVCFHGCEERHAQKQHEEEQVPLVRGRSSSLKEAKTGAVG